MENHYLIKFNDKEKNYKINHLFTKKKKINPLINKKNLIIEEQKLN